MSQSNVNIADYIAGYADDIVKYSKDYWTEYALSHGYDLKNTDIANLINDLTTETNTVANKIKKDGFSSLTLQEIKDKVYEPIAFIMTKDIK